MAERVKWRWLALAGVGLGISGSSGLAACGGDDTSEMGGDDGGTDASRDATTDTTTHDANVDSAPSDANVDSAPRDANVDAGDTACPSPATICGGSCVDVTTDPNNCGVCSKACGAGNTCVSGTCGNTVTQIAAGELVACALRVDGTVWCWGSNQFGELGSAPTGADGGCGPGNECAPTPQKVPGITGAVEVTVGTEFACALNTDGTLWCWGKNDQGQLGHAPSADSACANGGDAGTTTPCAPTPTQVPFPANVQISSASAGWLHACARTRGTPIDGGTYAGDVYCWGDNTQDEVGIFRDAGVTFPVPSKISGFSGDVVDLHSALGGRYACAVRQDGSVWCWGANFAGRLGVPQGSGIDCPSGPANFCNPFPVQVRLWDADAGAEAGVDAGDIGLGAPLANVRGVRPGSGSACAVKTDDTVWCWGNDGWAIFADNGPFDLTAQHPGARQVPSIKVKEMDNRYVTAYGIDGNGALWTWGRNTFGESGNGSITGGVACPIQSDGGSCTTPPAPTPSLSGLKQVSAGVGFAVGLKLDGTVLAWGQNDRGQLGHTPLTASDVVCGESFNTLTTAPCNPIPAKVALP